MSNNRRIISFILVLVMLFTLVPKMPIANAATSAISGLAVGTKIIFSGREFAVINPATGLVVSLKNIANMNYDASVAHVTYNPSDSDNVGYYLNNTYYNTFTAGEKALIQNTTWYTGMVGSETNSSVVAKIGLLRQSQYTTTIFPASGEASAWWLMTPDTTSGVRIVNVDSTTTNTSPCGGSAGGVRPTFSIAPATVFTKDDGSGMYYYGSAGASTTISGLSVGNTILFAGDAWKVLDPSTGLVVSDRIITRQAYDPNNTQIFDPTGTTYGTNNIGYYLNTTYYNTLSASDKLFIKSTTKYIGNETNEVASSVVCNIGLLRESEYLAAKAAGIFLSAGEFANMWLMTYASTNSTRDRYVNASGIVSEMTANTLFGIRPTLCLKETSSAVSVGSGVYIIVPDTTPPTAGMTYNLTGPYNSGTVVTITATFSEPVADSPVPQISISGANVLAATNMTKTDTTHYTYIYTVGAGDGTATVAMATAQDLAGNIVTAAPTSGATFTVDNTAPLIIVPEPGYATGTASGDRKWFRYYIGKDANGITKVMLVAPRAGVGVDAVKQGTFLKAEILDGQNKFITGSIYYIGRDGKIYEYQ